MLITLERFCWADWGTFGRIIMPDGMTLASVERPWLGNKRRVSCIPNGNYKCAPRRYNRGGYDAVEVLNVPDRDYILFHKGNYVHNSMGCILVNERHGARGDEWCGRNSAGAWATFMSVVGGVAFDLEITSI